MNAFEGTDRNISALPRFCLIHSVGDAVVPISSSELFSEALSSVGVRSECLRYSEGTHYDSLFGLADAQNPLFTHLMYDIVSRVFEAKEEKRDTSNEVQSVATESVEDNSGEEIKFAEEDA